MFGISLWRGAGSNCKLHKHQKHKSDLQVVLHKFIDCHNGGLVTAAVAVVGRREDSHNVAVMCPVVSVHHELVGTCDSAQVVRVVKLFRDILTEGVTSTSWRDAPATAVIRV